MSHTHWLVQFHTGSYHFGRPGAGDELVDTAATDPLDPQPLSDAMRAAGYGGQPAMLAIPSDWCLSASSVLASRRITRNRQAVTYAAEEHLPLSAEEMVCDFVARETNVLSIAVETSQLLPVVRSLEEAGIPVATVSPTAVLLLQRLTQMRRLTPSGVVLLADGQVCEYFLIEGGKPCQWRSLPLEAETIQREVATLLLSREDEGTPLHVTTVGLTSEIRSLLGDLDPDVMLHALELDNDQAVLVEASGVLAKGKRPWIELRRDQVGQYDPYGLVRGSMRALLVALLLAMFSLTIAAWTRGSKYESYVRSVESDKRELFQELFPEARVPAGIRSRLESERRKLLGLSANEVDAPQLQCVTGFFVNTLAALPTDLRMRLVGMRFEEGNGFLEGEVRRHGDVDVIATALRSHGFAVEPLGTEQLDDKGVGFDLNVSIAEDDAEPAR